VQRAIHDVSNLQEQHAQQLRYLNQEVASFSIEPAVVAVRKEFDNHKEVVEYLEAVAEDLMKNVDQFFSVSDDDENKQNAAMPSDEHDPFDKYQVNLLVDNTETDGAPVVVLDNATYPNLFGKIEYRAVMGTWVSDFTLIKSGALHQANGGYLVLNADNLMRNPMSWEGLKVAFKRGEIALEDPSFWGSNTTPESLKPKSVALDVKVIIVGNHSLYHMIEAYDEDFSKFFSVKCEFANQIDWKAKYVKQFGPFIRARCEERCLLPFDPTGVARIVEYAGQLVSSQRKLSVRFSDVMSVVRESVYWAQQAKAKCVTVAHVEKALEEKHYRSNLVEESIQEMIKDGSILVASKGKTVGQINGLTVYDLGDISFGRPVRITATAYMGKDGMVDVESAADLSGKIHTKGQFIIKGWFGENFAIDQPLSLSGSLTFEQTYGPVDGDSASCAEIIALLSALSGVPVKQELAITGSMNQKGEVQPIGGVNEKIEGFFRVCQAKKLTGHQGVVIPVQNEDDLMLHRDVVAAVEAGKFHVWSIKTIEDGLKIMTGEDPGKRKRGKFPDGSLYEKVEARLQAFNEGFDPPEDEEDEA
jgi:lon-related putative ATP-dependent protease